MGSQQRDGVQQCTKGWLQEVKSWFNFGRKTSPGSMWQCPKTRPNWARKVAISILALASSFSFSKPQLGPSLPIGGGGGNQLNRAIAAQQADYSSFPGGGGNQLNRLIGARQADYSSFPGGGNQLNRLIAAQQADYSSFPGRDYQAANSNFAAYCPMCCVLVRICG